MSPHFELIEPGPVLRPYVKHYWFLSQEGRLPVTERTLPVGSLQLIFHRGKPLHVAAAATGLQASAFAPAAQPEAFIAGQSLGFSDVVSAGPLEMIAVVFRPFASTLFLNVPADRFYNRLVDVRDMDDRALRELAFRVEEAPDRTSSIGLIEHFLAGRLSVKSPYNLARMQTALQAIQWQPELKVEKLAENVCLGPKQFGRLFTSYIGASPKAFLRIVRMQRALHLLSRSPGMSLAYLAYAAGFSDQSHLIKEFRLFSGYTPTEYMAICAPYSDYFSDE